MIPVPKYLRNIAIIENGKDNKITFSLKCKCGFERFVLYDNFSSESARELLKAQCSACQAEYVIYDSSLYGYDGMTFDKESYEVKYDPRLRQKSKKPLKLLITVENDATLEEFKSNTGLDFSMDEYSNSFSWIVVHGIDENQKKKKIFETETA